MAHRDLEKNFEQRLRVVATNSKHQWHCGAQQSPLRGVQVLRLP